VANDFGIDFGKIDCVVDAEKHLKHPFGFQVVVELVFSVVLFDFWDQKIYVLELSCHEF